MYRLAVLLLVSTAVLGCKRRIDANKLDTAIRDMLQKAGAQAKDLSCPKDREIKEGDTFECTVTLEGGETMAIEITQTDNDGNVHMKSKKMIIGPSEIAGVVAEKFGMTQKAKVTCDKSVVAKDDVLSCELADGSKHAKIEVTILDDTGRFRWKELRDPAAAPPPGEPAGDEPAEPADPPADDEPAHGDDGE